MSKRVLIDCIHYGLMFLLFFGYNKLEDDRGDMFALLCAIPAMLIVGISWHIAYKRVSD